MKQTILITGASRGLGAAAAQAAARLGANVVLAARTLERLEEQAAVVRRLGGEALAVCMDVSREEDCRVLVARAVEQFGRIDGLVNNSGVIEPFGPVSEAQAEDWQYNWRVNLLGPVLLTKFALPYLRQAKGRVINISSGSAENVIGGWGAYSSTKAALNHLSRILAREEADVTVVALKPGIVDTEMQAQIREKGRDRMAENSYQWLSGLHAQGKLLPVESPGKAIACLALFAPPDWSGQLLQWDDPQVQSLVASQR
jgi:NAD(P)-dependent dehydrogenase (short-subunit alcohol dehydrogenase family)